MKPRLWTLPVIALLLAHPSLLSGQQTEWEPVDVGLETANILKLDKEFAAAVLARNLEKAVGYLANNSWFLGPRGSYTQRGFVSAWAEFMDPESIVRWIRRPQDATVSLSGDIAYAIGEYFVALPNEDGTQSRGTGMSFTVWQKELGGNDWALLWESFPTPTKR